VNGLPFALSRAGLLLVVDIQGWFVLPGEVQISEAGASVIGNQ